MEDLREGKEEIAKKERVDPCKAAEVEGGEYKERPSGFKRLYSTGVVKN